MGKTIQKPRRSVRIKAQRQRQERMDLRIHRERYVKPRSILGNVSITGIDADEEEKSNRMTPIASPPGQKPDPRMTTGLKPVDAVTTADVPQSKEGLPILDTTQGVTPKKGVTENTERGHTMDQAVSHYSQMVPKIAHFIGLK